MPVLSNYNLAQPSRYAKELSVRELWSKPVNTEARAKILEALNPEHGEPFLTISQIARLFYSRKRDGRPAKSPEVFPRKTSSKGYKFPEGYWSAQAILRDMSATERKVKNRKTGEIKKVKVKRPDLMCYPDPFDNRKQNLYCWPGTKKPINDGHLYGHEMDAANCFVALKRALGSRLVRWEKPSLSADWQRQFARPFDVRPDRVFEIDGVDQVFMLEVDRGTENEWKQVWPKFDGYMRMGAALRGQRFTVLFTNQAYRYEKEDRERLEKLIPLVAKAKKGLQFLLTTQDMFKEDPLGPIWETDQRTGISILAL